MCKLGQKYWGNTNHFLIGAYLDFTKSPVQAIMVAHQKIHLFSNGSMVIVELLRLVHTGSQVLSPSSLDVNPSDLNHREHESWDLPLHMGSQVLIPKYDVDAYMATLFGGEVRDLC